MSPFAGYFWNLVRTAAGLGFIVGTSGGILFGLLRGRWWLGLLLTVTAYGIVTAVSEGLRFLIRFGGYGVPVLLLGYLGCVVPARILEARAGWRPVWGTLVGLGLIVALMFAVRSMSGFGTWVPLGATGVADLGLALLWIWQRRARGLSGPP